MPRAAGRPEKPVDPESPYADLAVLLRRLRNKSGLTYRELADRAGYPAASLAEAARGQRLPSFELTQAFIAACGGPDEEWLHKWAKVSSPGRIPSGPSGEAGIQPELISTHAEFISELIRLWKRTGFSYRQVERISDGRLRRSTLSTLLAGQAMPTWATTQAFISICTGNTAAPKMISSQWRYAWERARADALARPSHATRRVPVQNCDPYQLGVHRSYSPHDDARLTAYITRGTAETRLRRALSRSRSQNAFILLTGQPGAGKSRLAYEVVHDVLGDFGLLQPASVNELRTVPPARTVIWLDHVDQYLGQEGLTRGAVRALLLGPGPVTILGTIWPSRYHKYMTLPADGESDMYEREREALALAMVIDVPSELSEAEVAQARTSARRDPALAAALNTTGREIFQALTAGPHLVRRWTAAADVYAKAVITAAVSMRRAGTRRPLKADEIREAAVAQLTTLQLAQAPAGWLEEALAYATAPVPGGIPALIPVSTSTDKTQIDGYEAAGYLVWHREFLDPQPRTEGAGRGRPDEPEDDCALDHDTSYELMRHHGAVPVMSRRELDVLFSLCRPALSTDAFAVPAAAREIAADLEVTEAAVKQHLLRLYQKFKIPEGPSRRTRLANEVIARGLVRPLTESDPGRTTVGISSGGSLEAENGPAQSLAAAPQLVARWERARASDPYAWAVLTAALDAARLGARAPLSGGYLRAAAPGYCTHQQQAKAPPNWFERALAYATARLHGAAALVPAGTGMGQIDGYVVADYLLQHAIRERRTAQVPATTWDALLSYIRDPGDTARLADSAKNQLLYRYAIPLYRHAADAGDQNAAWLLAGLQVGQGDLDGLRARAGDGDHAATRQLAGLLAGTGDLDGAAQVLRGRGGDGDYDAARRPAGLLAGRGDLDGLRARADAGDHDAAWRLADLLAGRGDLDGLRARADAGDGYAARQLAGLLAGSGDLDGAAQVLRGRADEGDRYAARLLAGLLAERGDLDGLRARADKGDHDAGQLLATLLAGRGELGEAIARGLQASRLKSRGEFASQRKQHPARRSHDIREEVR